MALLRGRKLQAAVKNFLLSSRLPERDCCWLLSCASLLETFIQTVSLLWQRNLHENAELLFTCGDQQSLVVALKQTDHFWILCSAHWQCTAASQYGNLLGRLVYIECENVHRGMKGTFLPNHFTSATWMPQIVRCEQPDIKAGHFTLGSNNASL